jgi:RNA polymerase sigma-70 factor (ECF subfamily)
VPAAIVESSILFHSKDSLDTVRPNSFCLDRSVTILNHTHAIDRFLAGVERRALRMAQIATGNDDEALDLVQDAMVRLVQHYADRDDSEWGPLFHCILQSRIRDWYRRTRVRNRWREWFGKRSEDDEHRDDPLESVADPSAGPDEELRRKRAGIALQAALRTLPLRQQQAFLLRVWEELDVAQTATAMNCSEGSVKTHLFRAVRALRKQLGEHWP